MKQGRIREIKERMKVNGTFVVDNGDVEVAGLHVDRLKAQLVRTVSHGTLQRLYEARKRRRIDLETVSTSEITDNNR